MRLKQRFLKAVSSGELGMETDLGTIITVSEFKAYFKDVNACYIKSFLPAAAIEEGQHSVSHTHYVFRIRKGVYLVHPDALRDAWVNSSHDSSGN